MKKRLKKLFVSCLVLLIVGELIARIGFGLGDMPVFIEDDQYEYIYAPNQDVSRFGNKIQTNSYSMRSKPLSKGDKVKILKIGDSIINGGAHTDQDDLATTRLEDSLSLHFNDTIRVLNISAASWGPDNAFAYINKHGHFDAKMLFLVFSSHDLHDNMHHKKVVGEHPAWPAEAPLTGLTDGVGRYVWPKIKSWVSDDYHEYEYLVGFDDSKINPGWQQFIDYANSNNLELVFYLHPEQEEAYQGSMNSYGLELEAMLQSKGVRLYSGLDVGFTSADYRDNIHLNAAGQKKMADYIYPIMEALVDEIN